MNQKGIVLVVEDDHDTRVALRRCLEGAGYSIVSATNGANALELLGNMSPPKAILLDITMPIMSGDQFLSAVSTKPALASIPIIQITAAQNTKRFGVRHALKKPLDLDELVRVIESC